MVFEIHIHTGRKREREILVVKKVNDTQNETRNVAKHPGVVVFFHSVLSFSCSYPVIFIILNSTPFWKSSMSTIDNKWWGIALDYAQHTVHRPLCEQWIINEWRLKWRHTTITATSTQCPFVFTFRWAENTLTHTHTHRTWHGIAHFLNVSLPLTPSPPPPSPPHMHSHILFARFVCLTWFVWFRHANFHPVRVYVSWKSKGHTHRLPTLIWFASFHVFSIVFRLLLLWNFFSFHSLLIWLHWTSERQPGLFIRANIIECCCWVVYLGTYHNKSVLISLEFSVCVFGRLVGRSIGRFHFFRILPFRTLYPMRFNALTSLHLLTHSPLCFYSAAWMNSGAI